MVTPSDALVINTASAPYFHKMRLVTLTLGKDIRLSAHRKRNRKLKNLEKNMSNQTSDHNKRIAKNTIFLIYE